MNVVQNIHQEGIDYSILVMCYDHPTLTCP